MKKNGKILSLICCCTAILAVAGCAMHAEPPKKAEETVSTATAAPEVTVAPEETAVPESTDGTVTEVNPEEEEEVMITIKMKDGGVMKLELYPDKAPKTVENFTKLANEGFYDGLTFHRIIDGFMIQGGDPEGTGFGGSSKTVPGEFASNGYTQNDIAHDRGVISMARSQDPNSASSQFFIVHEAAPHLDGQYAAFGMLTEGFDVLDRLAKTEVGADGQTPLAKPVIESITVE